MQNVSTQYLYSHFLPAFVHTYSFFHFSPILEFFGESLGTCVDSELLLRELAAKIFGLLSCQSILLRVVHNKL